MKSILTVTINPAIDISSDVQHVISGRKLRCSAPRYEPGGGGVNVSRAIARLGGQSTALVTSGGDRGVLLMHSLEQEGIAFRAVAALGSTRENFAVVEESSGNMYRFIMPGAHLDESEWMNFLDELAAVTPVPDYLVASGSLPSGVPVDFYARMADIARELGARMILDTSGEALRQGTGAGVYLVKPNLHELSQLAGTEIADEAQQESAALRLVEEGACEATVVSLGAAGALLVSREGIERFAAPSVTVKSRVGAGDSMVAAITISLARGNALRDSVLFGIAAGSAAAMTPGTELCRLEDTDRLFERVRLKSAFALP